jgi:hypothetical protein
MKRVSNLKDSIMMPPPKARPKSRSDTSEELKKNLTESITNISENSIIHEEFQRFYREMDENTSDNRRNEDDWLSISKSTSSINFDKTNQINNSNQPGLYGNKMGFNFNLINYNYNCTQFSDEEECSDTLVTLEKLRENLTEDKKIVKNISNNLNHCNNCNSHPVYKQFIKLPMPANKKEIKAFVLNMISYIGDHEFDLNLAHLKIKIQTRDNDYRNKALNLEYFKECLMKMQSELLARICMNNKNGNLNLVFENGKFEMINKKRKRTEDGLNIICESDSEESVSDSEGSWDSLKKVGIF